MYAKFNPIYGTLREQMRIQEKHDTKRKTNL